MSEVERLRSSFPVYPGVVQIPDDFSVAAPNIASLRLSFKSDAPFEEVRRFHFDKLTAEGWQLDEDKELVERGGQGKDEQDTKLPI
jgi:hypothetical protein